MDKRCLTIIFRLGKNSSTTFCPVDKSFFRSPRFHFICKPFYLRKQLSRVVNRRVVPVVVLDDPKQPSIVIRIAPTRIAPLYPALLIVTTVRNWIKMRTLKKKGRKEVYDCSKGEEMQTIVDVMRNTIRGLVFNKRKSRQDFTFKKESTRSNFGCRQRFGAQGAPYGVAVRLLDCGAGDRYIFVRWRESVAFFVKTQHLERNVDMLAFVLLM
uniref:Uncharacterized protein n=1 Tax=Romanomermis culicivorax TaxID=13658 RepID=A0A915KYA6_ROMCU